MAQERRRYELRDPKLNRQLEELVAEAQKVHGPSEDGEMLRQILVTGLRLLSDRTPRADLKLINSALKELRHALFTFAPYEHVRKVAIFGSARTPREAPEWKSAHEFAERLAQAGWMVITGAGDGIMGAAQGGAGREKSFGVNIRLPFEQAANPVIAGDKKLVNFRYFFTRKLMFVKESHAIALFPGGFGTHDEGYEALTLVQTGKSELIPIVFVDAEGGTYWSSWEQYVRKHLHARGLISADDLALFKVTDSVDAAVHEVMRFYSNYHSSRYVRELLVMRVHRAPDGGQLRELNREFKDILVSGAIEAREPLPEERGECPEFARVTLHFNRRDVGRVRRLVDRLNGFAPGTASPPQEASPHEIIPQRLPPEAEREEDDLGVPPPGRKGS